MHFKLILKLIIKSGAGRTKKSLYFNEFTSPQKEEGLRIARV